MSAHSFPAPFRFTRPFHPILERVLLLLLALMVVGSEALQAQDVRLLMPVKVKPPFNDFMLEDLNGKVWQLSKLKGKVVVINFWSTACPVCRVEMPTLEKLWKKMQPLDIQVLTIHRGGSEKEVRAFVKEHGLHLPVLHDEFKQVSKAWGVFQEPITFVLDQNGRLAYIAFGGRNWMNPEIVSMLLALRPPL